MTKRPLYQDLLPPEVQRHFRVKNQAAQEQADA
jgi:hypothetical protein